MCNTISKLQITNIGDGLSWLLLYINVYSPVAFDLVLAPVTVNDV